MFAVAFIFQIIFAVGSADTATSAFIEPLSEMKGNLAIIRSDTSICFSRGTRSLIVFFSYPKPKRELSAAGKIFPEIDSSRWGYGDEVVYEYKPNGFLLGVVERGRVYEPDAVLKLERNWSESLGNAELKTFPFLLNADIELDSPPDILYKLDMLELLQMIIPDVKSQYISVKHRKDDISIRSVGIIKNNIQVVNTEMKIVKSSSNSDSISYSVQSRVDESKQLIIYAGNKKISIEVVPGSAMNDGEDLLEKLKYFFSLNY